MREYKIEVKAYMMQKSTPDFDFMERWNNDVPMPLKIMYGVKLKETKGMVRMRLHGDIKEETTSICMMCGRPITNPVSRYFGIGPKCGGHGYVNPFNSEEELHKAVEDYRAKLVNTVWEGWIIKSAIESIDGDCDIHSKIQEMPIEQLAQKSTVTATTSVAGTIFGTVGTPKKCTDDFSVFLKFKYNPEVKDTIKTLNDRSWDDENKQWEIAYSELGSLKDKLPDYKFEISNEEIIPKQVAFTGEFDYKTEPMAHQVEGVVYGMTHNRWLLGDDMGLGKTKQIIDLAVVRKKYNSFKHCLIVCGVNSLKWNWQEEIAKHSNESCYLLGQRRLKKSGRLVVKGNKEKLEDLLRFDEKVGACYFVVTNIESLRDERIAQELQKLCDAGEINMVAVDEVHRCKNLNTKQGAGLIQLQPIYRIGMTGTPLINTPLDLFAILKWLGYQKYGYLSFKNYFCNVDEWGGVYSYKNIDELEDKLASIMLRRRKEDVLDLPDKIYMTDYIDLTDEQIDLYNQVINAAIEDPELDDQISTDCKLAIIMRLRQVSGGIAPFDFIKKNPKLDRLEQLVEEAVYSGTKVIVYSNWVGGVNPAVERLQKYNPVVITGETKDADRQALINRFQADPEVKVVCGTIGALGTGVTCTAASVVIFLDEPWNDAIKEQAVDRAHRIGQKTSVTVHTIIGHDTYDEVVRDIVLGKRDLSDAIVDKNALAMLRIA